MTKITNRPTRQYGLPVLSSGTSVSLTTLPFYRGLDRGRRLFKQLAVGAGLRHPCQLVHVVRRQSEAGRHELAALVIYRAAHLFFVKIAADDIGIVNGRRCLRLQALAGSIYRNGGRYFPIRTENIFSSPYPLRSGRWSSGDRLLKRAYSPFQNSLTVPVEPWRCLPIITSPRLAVSRSRCAILRYVWQNARRFRRCCV